jgi:hypothetical protein
MLGISFKLLYYQNTTMSTPVRNGSVHTNSADAHSSTSRPVRNGSVAVSSADARLTVTKPVRNGSARK